MLDYADVIAINKFDKAGALDALHDVRKQYKRNHGLWTAKDDELPVVGTIAAQFNDQGIMCCLKIGSAVNTKTGVEFGAVEQHAHVSTPPPNRRLFRRVVYGTGQKLQKTTAATTTGQQSKVHCLQAIPDQRHIG
jgi:putative protein kinase ArgK-like GTPase of G3E family